MKKLILSLILAGCGSAPPHTQLAEGAEFYKEKAGAARDKAVSDIDSEYLRFKETVAARYEQAEDHLWSRGPQEMRHGKQRKDGRDGVNGLQGVQGESGDRGVPGQQGEAGIAGRDGSPGKDGADGLDGATGAQGEAGERGPRGPRGKRGLPGADSIVEVIDPCGDNPGEVDEVLFKMGDGSVTAWYSGVGLVVLAPNTWYQTTDSQQCVFRIVDGEIEY